ncbi:MAG: PAS domain S-box protein, partial [Nitrospira sp.]|nr:PAS domain S-box protein [Nitrospira sp.]
MKAKRPDEPAKAPALRRQAEALLRTTKRDVAAMPAKDVQQLVHELQIHQIELEMQNDELRRTQAELEATRDRYADLYDFSPVGHLALDAQGNILGANIMAGTLLGLSRNRLSGQPLARYIAGEDQDTFHRHVRDVLEGRAQCLCEVRLRRESGVSCCLLLKSLAVPDESGRIASWRTALLDISERKRAEEDLKRLNAELALANERWDRVMRATNDGVWDWDLVHGTAYFSPQWKAMHGFDEQDRPESSEEWLNRIHPGDRALVRGKLEAYWKQQAPEFWEEYRIRRTDGTWMWVLDRGTAIFDEQGHVVRMVGAETDITWRKEVEEAMRRREYEFRTLADNVPAFFSYVDQDRRYQFVNRRYETLFQRSA